MAERRLYSPGDTISEIATALNWPRSTTRDWVQAGMKEGRYVEGWAWRRDIKGRRYKALVYSIKEDKK